MSYVLSTAALIALVVLAVVWDLRTRRIPNALTVSGFFAALVLRALPGGEALLAGVLGGLIGLALTFPLVLMGGLGGGDAKLLGAVGAFLGPANLPLALFVTALVGGAMALALAVHRRALGETLRHARVLAGSVAMRTPATARNLTTPGALTIPYGVAIGAGALAGWLA
ncbi:MAG: A24 family peptidase [Candidatus Limnocylindria bacterium]